jgi:hypothetical protein
MERFQRYSDLQMYLRSLAYTKKLNNLNLIFFYLLNITNVKDVTVAKIGNVRKNICVAYGAQTDFLYISSLNSI